MFKPKYDKIKNIKGVFMKKKNIILIVLFIMGILLDQFSKGLIANNMHLYESIEVIPGFFSITYTQNTGAAWSMMEGQMLFFYVITVVAVVVLVAFYKSLEDTQFLSKIGIVLMLSGTTGNFIDRIVFQYVRDFLDFIIFGYDFPIFNVADCCLCIGVALILLEEFMDYYKVGVKWKQKDIQ